MASETSLFENGCYHAFKTIGRGHEERHRKATYVVFTK